MSYLSVYNHVTGINLIVNRMLNMLLTRILLCRELYVHNCLRCFGSRRKSLKFNSMYKILRWYLKEWILVNSHYNEGLNMIWRHKDIYFRFRQSEISQETVRFLSNTCRSFHSISNASPGCQRTDILCVHFSISSSINNCGMHFMFSFYFFPRHIVFHSNSNQNAGFHIQTYYTRQV